MAVKERPFSDLLRRPKDVATDVDNGDVLLRRRDEPDLRLSRADREAERTSTFAALGRTLSNLARHHPRIVAGALADVFPWMSFLPAKDRRAFIDEFVEMAAAATELDSYGLLSQTIHEWRATALVHSDPDLRDNLQRPILEADGGRVEPPEL